MRPLITITMTLTVLLFFIPRVVGADFKEVLAQRLTTDAKFLVLNLPPRPGSWPGAIFTDDMRVPIVRGRKDDPALARGEPISIEMADVIDVAAGANVGWGAWFSMAAKASDVADVRINFPDVRIVDIELGDLLKRVQESSVARAAAKRGRIPLVIVKSYEGTPTFTLIKKAAASGAAWAEIKKAAVDAKIEAGAISEDHVVYKSVAAVVFAFETMQATFDLAQIESDNISWRLEKSTSSTFSGYMLAQENGELARTLSAVTGISIDGITKGGLLGGPASEVRQLCKIFGNAC